MNNYNVEEIIAILKESSAATVYSLLGEERPKYLMLGVKPLLPGMKAVGFALTVEYVPYEPGVEGVARGNPIHDVYDLISGGEVVVAAALGRDDVGVFGDCILTGFKYKGASGVVVDGGIRDSPQVIRLGLPVFAKGTTPEHIGGKIVPYRVNVPVVCAGVLVRPKDIVVADMDGVVVVPAERLKDVALKAREVERKEKIIRRMITAGIPLRDSYPPRRDLYEKFSKGEF